MLRKGLVDRGVPEHVAIETRDCMLSHSRSSTDAGSPAMEGFREGRELRWQSLPRLRVLALVMALLVVESGSPVIRILCSIRLRLDCYNTGLKN